MEDVEKLERSSIEVFKVIMDVLLFESLGKECKDIVVEEKYLLFEF